MTKQEQEQRAIAQAQYRAIIEQLEDEIADRDRMIEQLLKRQSETSRALRGARGEAYTPVEDR